MKDRTCKRKRIIHTNSDHDRDIPASASSVCRCALLAFFFRHNYVGKPDAFLVSFVVNHFVLREVWDAMRGQGDNMVSVRSFLNFFFGENRANRVSK
jgi:hypothetical protein